MLEPAKIQPGHVLKLTMPSSEVIYFLVLEIKFQEHGKFPARWVQTRMLSGEPDTIRFIFYENGDHGEWELVT